MVPWGAKTHSGWTVAGKASAIASTAAAGAPAIAAAKSD